jgi:predicted glycosyltransferase
VKWTAGIYYTHYQCLGHTSRVFSVTSLLKKVFPEGRFCCIQGGRSQGFLQDFPSTFIYTLSYPLFSRDNFLVSPRMDNMAAREIRAKESLSFIRQHTPDIFFTEYFPLGRLSLRLELWPSLVYLAKQGKNIYSVAGYPLMAEGTPSQREALLKFYRRVFVHCPVMEKKYIADTYETSRERQVYRAFFERHEKKIRFTNYLPPPPLPFVSDRDERITLKKGAVNILVARGGGAYYPKILTAALEASDILGDDFFFTLIAGPATTEKELGIFLKVLGRKKLNNARLVISTSRYEELIAKCDLCISPAPYHTSVFLLKHQKKAIVIPMEGSGKVKLREQTARARMLKDMLGSRILSYADLSADKLTQQIRRLMRDSARRPFIPREWFSGEACWLQAFRDSL